MSKSKEILELARKQQFERLLDTAPFVNIELLEAGISRIQRFIQDNRPFALITAFKGYNSRAENHEKNSELMSDLRSFGLGAIQLNGYYKEKDMAEPSRELSFFVPYLGDDEAAFRKFMTAMCTKYEQECVGYSEGKQYGLLFANGTFDPKFSAVSFGPAQVKEAWSRLRGKWFVMVECAFCASSNIGRQAWDALGLIPGVVFDKRAIKAAWTLKH